MNDKYYEFKVTGHSDGPNCDVCGTPMDTLKALSNSEKLNGNLIAYCPYCTYKIKVK